jgi:ABC-type multidrug transport system ATPase subunit
MDPEARRFMWSVVAKIQKHSAIILTSHMMEEAEFLCTKMGIMIKGGMFKCFGTTQEIKQRYGLGYEIEVKIKVPSQELIDQIIKCDLNSSCIDPVNDENDASQKRLFVSQTLNKLMQ